jgi:hypothetical protein
MGHFETALDTPDRIVQTDVDHSQVVDGETQSSLGELEVLRRLADGRQGRAHRHGACVNVLKHVDHPLRRARIDLSRT